MEQRLRAKANDGLSGTDKLISSDRTTSIAVLLLACTGAAVIAVLMGVDRNWDLLNYHIYSPLALLDGRLPTDVGAAFMQGYLPPLINFPNLLMFTVLNDYPVAIMAINGTVHGINFFLVFLIARRLFSKRPRVHQSIAVWFSVLTGSTGAIVISVLGTTTGDLVVSIFTLLAVFLLIKHLDMHDDDQAPRRNKRLILLAGMSIGFAAGLKLTMVVYAPALAAALLVSTSLKREGFICLSLFLLGAGIVYLACIGHHAYYLAEHFDSPVFPLFNDIFRSPFVNSESFRDERFLPSGIIDGLSYPFHWVSINKGVSTELPFRDWRFAFAYVAVSVILLNYFVQMACRFGSRGRPHKKERLVTSSERFLLVFWISAFFIWVSLFGISRYAISLDLLNGILISIFLLSFTKNIYQFFSINIAISICLITTTNYFDWGRENYGDKFLSADFPKIAPHSIIFIVEEKPLGFLAAFLPSGVPIMRYANYMTKLGDKNLFAERVRTALQDPSRVKYMIRIGAKQSGEIARNKLPFGLGLSEESCEPIKNNVGIYRGKLSLCRLVNRGRAGPKQ